MVGYIDMHEYWNIFIIIINIDVVIIIIISSSITIVKIMTQVRFWECVFGV